MSVGSLAVTSKVLINLINIYIPVVIVLLISPAAKIRVPEEEVKSKTPAEPFEVA